MPKVRFTCLIVGIPIVASLPYLHGYFGMSNSFAFWAIAIPTAVGAMSLMLHEISRRAGHPTNPSARNRLAVVLNALPFPIGIGFVYFGLSGHAAISFVVRLIASALAFVIFVFLWLVFAGDFFAGEVPTAIEYVVIYFGAGLLPLLVLLWDSVAIYRELEHSDMDFSVGVVSVAERRGEGKRTDEDAQGDSANVDTTGNQCHACGGRGYIVISGHPSKCWRCDGVSTLSA